MQKKLKVEYIKDRLPVRYRIHILIRGFMVMLSGATAAYSVYFLYFHVVTETPLFFKLLPLIIFFVAMDTVLKHILGLNSVTFWDDRLQLGFLAKPSIVIPYGKLRSISLKKQITYYLYIYYTDRKGKDQTFRIKGSFPKVLEIMLNLRDIVPNLELDEMTTKYCEYLASLVEPETINV